MAEKKTVEEAVERVEEQTEEVKSVEEQFISEEQTEEVETTHEIADEESGIFVDMIKNLQAANKLVKAHKKNVDAVLKDKDTPPEERQKLLMRTFNAAILSFAEADKALAREIKAKREELRREKDRVVKEIFK